MRSPSPSPSPVLRKSAKNPRNELCKLFANLSVFSSNKEKTLKDQVWRVYTRIQSEGGILKAVLRQSSTVDVLTRRQCRHVLAQHTHTLHTPQTHARADTRDELSKIRIDASIVLEISRNFAIRGEKIPLLSVLNIKKRKKLSAMNESVSRRRREWIQSADERRLVTSMSWKKISNKHAPI